MKDLILKLENISVGYHSKEIISEINASVFTNELVAVLGKNGAGKSTLINSILGFQKVIKGEIFIENKSLNKISSQEIAQQIALSQVTTSTTENPFKALSDREMQITMMITKGNKVQDIAESLSLSPKTVNSYRYRLFEKLNINGDVELTRMAIRYGILDAETL